jgi:sulfotransferase family protein
MNVPPPICITGMHRSGTSLTANLLRQCGVWLGREEELCGATPDNPDGHWEHLALVETNDALLNEFGGGWDQPPVFGECWLTRKNVGCLRDKATAIYDGLARGTGWGWKDPRASLLMPFWLAVWPGTRVVICLRNPLEVALSLRRRALMSYSLGLSLWKIYNQSVLAAVPREQRIVTHFDHHFSKPAEELGRLATFCGIDVAQEKIDAAIRTTKTAFRHSQFGIGRLIEVEVAPEIVELYSQMCDEAGFREPAPAPRENPPQHAMPNGGDNGSARSNGRQIDLQAMERQMLLDAASATPAVPAGGDEKITAGEPPPDAVQAASNEAVPAGVTAQDSPQTLGSDQI